MGIVLQGSCVELREEVDLGNFHAAVLEAAQFNTGTQPVSIFYHVNENIVICCWIL
jgi:hypothetical protein